MTESEVWDLFRAEADVLIEREPVLASFYNASVLEHDNFSEALSFQLATCVGEVDIPAMSLRDVFQDAYEANSELLAEAIADLNAHVERDPACERYTQPFLFFKGFQALQVHRVAHWLHANDRGALAFFLQSVVASRFDVDIHPAATIGRGIMLDHATGIIIGETAVVGNDVSMLHGVTLGGCGHHGGDRHPKVGTGVMFGAGAKVLGNISIGANAKIAAGSVVLEDVPAGSTVAGVPAVIVGSGRTADPENSPAKSMAQSLD